MYHRYKPHFPRIIGNIQTILPKRLPKTFSFLSQQVFQKCFSPNSLKCSSHTIHSPKLCGEYSPQVQGKYFDTYVLMHQPTERHSTASRVKGTIWSLLKYSTSFAFQYHNLYRNLTRIDMTSFIYYTYIIVQSGRQKVHDVLRMAFLELEFTFSIWRPK